MKILATSVDDRFDTLAEDNFRFRNESANYFRCTEALQKQVRVLEADKSRIDRKACDALAAARAAEQGCVSDQRVVTGLLNADLSSVRDAFAVLGDKIGIEIGSEAIIDVRGRTFAGVASSGVRGADSSPPAVPGSAGRGSREIFVRFAFVELRTLLLQRAAALKGLKASDLGFGDDTDEFVKLYEVLVPHRQHLFMNIRSEAKKMGYQAWHSHGVFYCRKNRTARAIKVYEVADVRNLGC